MFHDLEHFIRDVFRQWWARIGVVNGLIGSTARVIRLDPTVEAWMSWGFGIAAGVLLLWAVFCVYRCRSCCLWTPW
jgi:hypothetical protein